MPTLQEIRRQLPELEGLDDDYAAQYIHETYFADQPFEKVAKAIGYTPPKAVDNRGDVSRGFGTAFKQLPQLGYGLVAGAGAVLENTFGEGGISTGIKKAGIEGYKEWEGKIQADSKESDSFNYSWEAAKEGDFGSLVDWMQYGLGYAGGQAVQMLATGGLGYLGGKVTLGKVATDLAKGMVKKEAAQIAATEAAKDLTKDQIIKMATANVAGKIGSTAALGASAVGMEGGEIFGGLTAENADRSLTGDEIAKAFGATLAAGGLEFVGDKLGLDLILGKSKLFKPAEAMAGMKGRAARAALGAAGAAPIEAGTEYLQTGLEEFGKGKEQEFLTPLQSEEARKQAFDAAMLGGLGGTVVGGGGGLMTPQKQAEQIANEGFDKIMSATTVDDAVAGMVQATEAPLPTLGITPEQEAQAMGAFEAQAKADEQMLRFGRGREPVSIQDQAPATIGQIDSPSPFQEPSAQFVEDAPFGDRVLTLREQLADPNTVRRLRELGGEALDTVSYYASIADRADVDMPEKTRERLLSLAEGIVGRATLKPIGESLRSDPQQIGFDAPEVSAPDIPPARAYRVDSQGTATPETLAQRNEAMAPELDRITQRAERTKTQEPVTVDAEQTPNAVRAYVDSQRQVNTPAARAFVREYEAGRITNQDVANLIAPKRPSESEDAQARIEAAAAQAPTDRDNESLILTRDGFPYGTLSAATIRANKEGGSVIEVPGGYAVRKEKASESVGDMAGTAGEPVGSSDGRSADTGRGELVVRPDVAEPGRLDRGAPGVVAGSDAAQSVPDGNGRGDDSLAGLPQGASFVEGKGALGKGKFAAQLPDGTRSNFYEDKRTAAADLANQVAAKNSNARADRLRSEAQSQLKSNGGSSASDDLLRAAGFGTNRDGTMPYTAFARVAREFIDLDQFKLKDAVRSLIKRSSGVMGGVSEQIDPKAALDLLASTRAAKQSEQTGPSGSAAPQESAAAPQGVVDGEKLQGPRQGEEVAQAEVQEPAGGAIGQRFVKPQPATELQERVAAKKRQAPTQEAQGETNTDATESRNPEIQRTVIELKKREAVLKRLLECMQG